MDDAEARPSRFTRFPPRKVRKRAAQAFGDARPPRGDELAEAAARYGAPQDVRRRATGPASRPDPVAPSPEAAASPASAADMPAPLSAIEVAASRRRERRRARRLRIARRLPILCCVLAVAIPVGALVAEVALTARCDVPLGAAAAGMRLTWHVAWLISTLATLLPVLYLAGRAPERFAGLLLLGAFVAWKGLGLLRDRIALPVCTQGWPAGTPRHPLEVELNVGVAVAFAVFAGLAALTALARRRQVAQAV